MNKPRFVVHHPGIVMLVMILSMAIISGMAQNPSDATGNMVRSLRPQCNDGIDNDRDGFCDYSRQGPKCRDGSRRGDLQCVNRYDNKEAADCVDVDQDGFGVGCVLGLDCNDNNPNIKPGATELCGNGVDENCDGQDSACPPRCGDGSCNGNETCSSCAVDCGSCPSNSTNTTNFCVDNDENDPNKIMIRSTCVDAAGTHTDYCESSTLRDWYCTGTWNGQQWSNMHCAPGGYVCPNGCSNGACANLVCGNSKCESGESCSSCSSDCGVCPEVCGNGRCAGIETCSSCSVDCGSCQNSSNLTSVAGMAVRYYYADSRKR